MKSITLYIMSALVCAPLLAVTEEETTATLEAGYRKAAGELKEGLIEALKERKSNQEIIKGLRSAIETENQISRETAKALNHPSSGDVTAPDHMQLDFVSEKPELLRRDPDDLYNRYRSTVEIGFVILDEKGEETNWNAIEVTLPVTANPDKQWKFPSTGDVMDAVLKECNRRGEGMLKINQERIATLKKIRGY